MMTDPTPDQIARAREIVVALYEKKSRGSLAAAVRDGLADDGPLVQTALAAITALDLPARLQAAKDAGREDAAGIADAKGSGSHDQNHTG